MASCSATALPSLHGGQTSHNYHAHHWNNAFPSGLEVYNQCDLLTLETEPTGLSLLLYHVSRATDTSSCNGKQSTKIKNDRQVLLLLFLSYPPFCFPLTVTTSLPSCGLWQGKYSRYLNPFEDTMIMRTPNIGFRADMCKLVLQCENCW